MRAVAIAAGDDWFTNLNSPDDVKPS
jgi:hypothetical protein